jgi:hypothetical protein
LGLATWVVVVSFLQYRKVRQPVSLLHSPQAAEIEATGEERTSKHGFMQGIKPCVARGLVHISF